jgi:hypothetical protein
MIIYCPAWKHNIYEVSYSLRFQVDPTQSGPIDRGNTPSKNRNYFF